jgi:nicotinamide-nucleotide amidase
MPEYRLTIAVAESVTCGHLQAKIGAHPSVAEIFKGGITAYSIDHKVRHLGVDATHASKTNCVSTRVADEMARGACALFGVEIGVATTGYADPPGKGKAPFAFWSLCHNDGTCLKIVKRGKVIGPKKISRADMQSKIAEAAFRALLGYLESQKA